MIYMGELYEFFTNTYFPFNPWEKAKLYLVVLSGRMLSGKSKEVCLESFRISSMRSAENKHPRFVYFDRQK